MSRKVCVYEICYSTLKYARVSFYLNSGDLNGTTFGCKITPCSFIVLVSDLVEMRLEVEDSLNESNKCFNTLLKIWSACPTHSHMSVEVDLV